MSTTAKHLFGKLPKKGLLFSAGAVAVASAALAGQHYRRTPPQPDSLWGALDHYGFKQVEQKEALEFLMQKSGIIQPQQSFREAFPTRSNQSLLLKDILALVGSTQEKFTIRTGTQERWEVSPTRWMEENREAVLAAITTLGLKEELPPTVQDSNVIVVLGARRSSMAARLDYAASLFNTGRLTAQHLMLLGGERRVTVGMEGSEAELKSLAEKYGVDLPKLSEMHLMQEEYSRSAISGKLPTHVIDTPAGEFSRATTNTTVQDFCRWLKDHPEVERVTFISNQPHVKYQEGVIAEVFKREGVTAAVTFEVVGPKASANLSIQEFVGAVGSQIWAQTPGVVAKIGVNALDPETSADILGSFEKLYSKQPLIYHNIKGLFSPAESDPKSKPAGGMKAR